jgi:hypothetical protein
MAAEQPEPWLRALITNKQRVIYVKTIVQFFITLSSLRRMRKVFEKNYRANENTNLMFSNFMSENRTVYEVLWKIL